MKEFMTKHPLILGLIAFIIGEVGVSVFHKGMALGLVLVGRMLLALIMLFFIGYFAGKSAIKWKKGVIGVSIRKSRYILILGFLIGLIGFLGMYLKGEFHANGFLLILGSLVMTLFVGIFEEALFRGIIFESFLFDFGKTRKGIMQAAIVTSFIFGFSHVYLDFFKGNPITGSFVMLVFLKTVESGMFGFFLAALYLRTKSIWGVALVHGLFDFFSVAPSFLMGTGLSIGYTGADGSNTLYTIAYVVTIILSIPLIVKGNRMIKEMELPQRGIFYETAFK
ncbi:MAG: CPBP family intramembrane glutamic endopeptidase [Eubacteriaceae bacterium]